jgi:hypothetical protein
MTPNLVGFYDADRLTVHITDAADGTKLLVFGVPDESAVVMPLSLFLHLVGRADDECAKQAILLHESMNQTKH